MTPEQDNNLAYSLAHSFQIRMSYHYLLRTHLESDAQLMNDGLEEDENPLLKERPNELLTLRL